MQLRPGQLQLTGYDLEFGIQTNLPVDTHDTGEFVIHARLFSEALRRFSGNTVLLEIDSRLAVTMHCEATEFHISAMSAEDYPSLPELEMEDGLTLEQGTLRSAIHQTSYATSLNENKPVFTGNSLKPSEMNCGSLPLTAIGLPSVPKRLQQKYHIILLYQSGHCWKLLRC